MQSPKEFEGKPITGKTTQGPVPVIHALNPLPESTQSLTRYRSHPELPPVPQAGPGSKADVRVTRPEPCQSQPRLRSARQARRCWNRAPRPR